MEPDMTPVKRNTGVPCEWKYDWTSQTSVVCGKPLTSREIEFCEKNKKTFNGKLLCYGHQKQYEEKFN